MRQSRWLAGSIASASSRGRLDWRYAAESMISRCSHFSDQPCSMNRAARSSSSSGCVGFSPCTPKSLGVATSGLPKCQRPDAVDDHPRRERCGIGEDLLGQFAPARARVKCRIALRQHGQETARANVARLGDVAARQHIQIARLAGLDVEHREVGIGCR